MRTISTDKNMNGDFTMNNETRTNIDTFVNEPGAVFSVKVTESGERFHCRISSLHGGLYEPTFACYFENLGSIYENAFEITRLYFPKKIAFKIALAIEKANNPGQSKSIMELLSAIDEYESELAGVCDDMDSDEDNDGQRLEEAIDDLNEIIDVLYKEASEILEDMYDFREKMGLRNE